MKGSRAHGVPCGSPVGQYPVGPRHRGASHLSHATRRPRSREYAGQGCVSCRREFAQMAGLRPCRRCITPRDGRGACGAATDRLILAGRRIGLLIIDHQAWDSSRRAIYPEKPVRLVRGASSRLPAAHSTHGVSVPIAVQDGRQRSTPVGKEREVVEVGKFGAARIERKS